MVVLLFTLSSSYAAERLVFEGDSAYTSMQVLDKSDGLRYLQFGIYEQTALRLSDPDLSRLPTCGFSASSSFSCAMLFSVTFLQTQEISRHKDTRHDQTLRRYPGL